MTVTQEKEMLIYFFLFFIRPAILDENFSAEPILGQILENPLSSRIARVIFFK